MIFPNLRRPLTLIGATGDPLKSHPSNPGFSLVEAMIVTVILCIAGLAISQIFVDSAKQMKAIEQKQELIELKNSLLESFADPAICTWQMRNNTLDVTGITPSHASTSSFSVPRLHAGSNPSSSVLVEAGQPLPGTQTKIRVSTIKFTNYIATGNPDAYSGQLEIAFDASTLVRPLRPVVLKKTLLVNGADPISARRVVSCAGFTPPPPSPTPTPAPSATPAGICHFDQYIGGVYERTGTQATTPNTAAMCDWTMGTVCQSHNCRDMSNPPPTGGQGLYDCTDNCQFY
jgi:type II secretory pathway pseudopilin PulG